MEGEGKEDRGENEGKRQREKLRKMRKKRK